MKLHVANAPASWGVEHPRDVANPPWTVMLDELAQAGYRGTELGPLGYLPDEEAALERELGRRHLELVAGYVFEPLHVRDGLADALDVARRICPLLVAAGASHLVIIQGFTPTRERAAGNKAARTSLTDDEWQTLVESVHELARMATRHHGLTACLHPHAGTHVEYDDEIDRLMEETDPDLVGLCVDTGHCAYAGVDPVALCERYAKRLSYLHLKDVDGERLRSVIARQLSFEEAVGKGVFCPLGEGLVDFGGLRDVLEEIDYEGWATVEQDRLPSDSNLPVDQARASLAHLRKLGLVSHAPDPVVAPPDPR